MSESVSQFVRFAAIGVGGFLVEASFVYFLNTSGLDLISSKLIGYFFAVIFTWSLNRNVTFKKFKSVNWIGELMMYFSATFIAALVNNGSYILLIFLIPFFEAYPILAVAVGALAGMFFNFFSSKKIVFKA